jgi:SAM-dependent methyltransferase
MSDDLLSPPTAEVVESYRTRAPFYRAETAHIRRPRSLWDVLHTARHVAEIPCGAGHFLSDYAGAEAVVTLVDACPEVLAFATQHAHDAGLPRERVRPELSTVQQLRALTDVDLVVMPNGAFNQISRQVPPLQLTTGLYSAMRPGAKLLAQVACTYASGDIDSSTFYDPRRAHDVWFIDHSFTPADGGGPILRHRRQHRNGETLRIDFDYRTPTGDSLHTAMVEMALLSGHDLVETFTAAGFVHVRILPGHDGLSELLAVTPGRAQR